ncbi:MAG: homoserine O-acetyltransferase [Actinomycetota bacterium]|nr:homoserine O-acetyltransferase [Actinomycetota bacterium]
MTAHADLPATGAWRPGDHPGRRQFLTFATDHGFAVESGTVLHDVVVAYETYGTLNEDGSNAVLVCHAWTGDSHAAGPAGRGHPAPGWWDEVIGPGLAIDTDQWFVVCPNVLGGCQGSTGPASAMPGDERPYGSRFPVITIRDMVRCQARLADHLGVDRWHAAVGGSMGGMQVLEWAVMYPDRVTSMIPIAACMQATAQQIAWGVIGRRAIRLDPAWQGGDYYESGVGQGPHAGLGVARMLAQVTFRSDNVFTDRFGRELVDRAAMGDTFGLWQEFEVERYLEHHGDKLARRFDANSYLVIGKAMDLHDIARGRGGVSQALDRFTGASLEIGISSDMLYPEYQQRAIHEARTARGFDSEFVRIESPHGHDAFLINLNQICEPLAKFLDRI